MEGVKPIVCLVAVLFIVGAAGCTVVAKGPHGRAGKSTIEHLYLFEKDPATWEIVENGSWGKMKFRIAGDLFDFVFNGHNLTPDWNYTLMYYPDPWPGTGLIVLGNGTVNDEGNIHIKNAVDTGDLPIKADENDGAKIWLVLSADIDTVGMQMVGWNPTAYLFEHNLITFDATD